MRAASWRTVASAAEEAQLVPIAALINGVADTVGNSGIEQAGAVTCQPDQQ